MIGDVAEIGSNAARIFHFQRKRHLNVVVLGGEILDRISVALLEKETISSEELDRLIAGETDSEESNTPESQPPTTTTPVESASKEEKEAKQPAPGLRPGLAGA